MPRYLVVGQARHHLPTQTALVGPRAGIQIEVEYGCDGNIIGSFERRSARSVVSVLIRNGLSLDACNGFVRSLTPDAAFGREQRLSVA